MQQSLNFLFVLCFVCIAGGALQAGQALPAQSQCENLTLTPDSLNEPILVFDIVKETQLPRNFRTTNDLFLKDAENATRQGLDRLHASASAQFSENNLKAALPSMPGKVYIVDLRRESHGFFDGEPISWFAKQNYSNGNKTAAEITAREHALLDNLRKKDTLSVSHIVTKKAYSITEARRCRVPYHRLEIEQHLVERLGLQYVRFLVSDHNIPDGRTVDAFVAFIKSLPRDAWLHFHCRAGRGRSSIFLAMFDIIRNGRDLSLDAILGRQVALGSVNLQKADKDNKRPWKHKNAEARVAFVRNFYDYVRDPQGYAAGPWTAWVARHRQQLYY